MKIKDLPKVDLPREKLEKYGVDKLCDHELLAILLGSGIKDFNVLQLSKKILRTISEIGKDKIKLEDLLKIKGLGKAKASQIISIFELGKRTYSNQNPEIVTPEDIWKYCLDIRDSKKEYFIVFYLDTQSRLIERQIISVGTLNESIVHPREVFEPAIKLSAFSIIIAHNHPSAELKPSKVDGEVTRRLFEAGKILGIEVSDHVIFSKAGYFSFKQNHIL